MKNDSENIDKKLKKRKPINGKKTKSRKTSSNLRLP